MTRFGLKCVDVPDDGHCFVSCIRLFFREYLPTVPDQTVAMLRDKFNRLNLRNAFYLQAGITDEQYDTHSREYFEHARFDNVFMDAFTGFRNELFNIKIIIVKVMEGETTMMIDTPNMAYDDERNHHPDHTILIVRDRRAHYQLLVPTNRHILSTISRFRNGVGGVISELNDQATEPTSTNHDPVAEKPRRERAPSKAKTKSRRKKTSTTDYVQRKRNRERQKRYQDNLTSAQKIERARKRRLTDAAKRKRNKEGMPYFRIAFTYEDINEEDEVHVEHDLGQMNIPCSSCGALHWEAERTGRKSTNFTMCCEKGKVTLPPLRDPPADLYAMFADQKDPMHEEMGKNALKYNASFSTASAVAETLAMRGNGPPVYKIHGQMVRRMSSLEPSDGKPHCFGQYFMLDTDIALDQRLNNPVNHDCKPEVIKFT